MKRLLNLIYPRVCHLCDRKLIDSEKFVCDSCFTTLPRPGSVGESVNPVEERLSGLFPFVKAHGVYIYAPGNVVAQLTYDFKYHNFPSLACCLGERMYDEVSHTDFFTNIQAVVPVPIHKLRRIRRGYNQSEMLARGLASKAGIPVVDVLRARRHTSQTRQKGIQRVLNAAGKYYAIDDDRMNSIDNVILVDDICTTGSTLCAAASALLEKYTHLRVSVITYAVTV